MSPIVTDGVAWSVCRSVCHDREPCKNGRTDQDAVWVVDSGGPKFGPSESTTQTASLSVLSFLQAKGSMCEMRGCTLAAPCKYDRTVHVRRRRCLFVKLFWPLVMAALWNRAGHYIFALWFLSSSIFFIPRLISAVVDWMSIILPHMVWP